LHGVIREVVETYTLGAAPRKGRDISYLIKRALNTSALFALLF